MLLLHSCTLTVEEATDHLLNLNPCGLKNMLYHLLSGKEFQIDHPGEICSLEQLASIRSHYFLSLAQYL